MQRERRGRAQPRISKSLAGGPQRCRSIVVGSRGPRRARSRFTGPKGTGAGEGCPPLTIAFSSNAPTGRSIGCGTRSKDTTAPGCSNAASQARPAHVARLLALRDEGRLLLAGPCPAIDAEDPGPAGFSGSIVVAEFESLEAARAWADAGPVRRSRRLPPRRCAPVQAHAAVITPAASRVERIRAVLDGALVAPIARGRRRQRAPCRPCRRARRARAFQCRHRERGLRGPRAAGAASQGVCGARRHDGDRYPRAVDSRTHAGRSERLSLLQCSTKLGLYTLFTVLCENVYIPATDEAVGRQWETLSRFAT